MDAKQETARVIPFPQGKPQQSRMPGRVLLPGRVLRVCQAGPRPLTSLPVFFLPVKRH